MKIVVIDQAKCTRCRICVKEFCCPSFMVMSDGKVMINRELCNSNGSCIQVCPEHAIIRVDASEETSNE